ncbi:3'-5' exonuclease [Aquirufa ecclesiirivi]
MIIKILDFDSENIEGDWVVEDKYLVSSFISDLFLNNYNKDLTIGLLIDNEKGIYQINNISNPINVIEKLSSDFPKVKFFICFEIEREYYDDTITELYFGLICQNRISYFALNNEFELFDIPKLYQYFKLLHPLYPAPSTAFPIYFNDFVDLKCILKDINFSRNMNFDSSKTTFLYYNSFNEFLHRDINRYVNDALNRFKWLYPSFNDENRYYNYDLLNDLDVPYYCIEGRDIKSKSLNKYTLVIDTETNGLPVEYNSYPYPEPVQISWAVYDSNDEIVQFRDYIVAPSNYSISEKSTQIHGISDDYARMNGYEIYDILLELDLVIKNCTLIIGHNLDFDLKVIESAAFPFANYFPKNYLSELGETFFGRYNFEYICTMKNSMNYLNSINIYKYPKLSELYKLLFKETPIGLHNSAVDIQLTFDIYIRMRKQNLFKKRNLDLLF